MVECNCKCLTQGKKCKPYKPMKHIVANTTVMGTEYEDSDTDDSKEEDESTAEPVNAYQNDGRLPSRNQIYFDVQQKDVTVAHVLLLLDEALKTMKG